MTHQLKSLADGKIVVALEVSLYINSLLLISCRVGIILPLYHTQCLPLYKFFWVTHHVHLIHVFLMIGERGKGVCV